MSRELAKESSSDCYIQVISKYEKYNPFIHQEVAFQVQNMTSHFALNRKILSCFMVIKGEGYVCLINSTALCTTERML